MRELMNDVLDVEALSEVEREALMLVLRSSQEEAREARLSWNVQQALHTQVAPFLQEKMLLVAYALEQAGRGEWLNEEERALLDAHGLALRSALRAHPGLHAAVERTVQDARLMERCFSTKTLARTPESRGPQARRRLVWGGSGVAVALSVLLLWMVYPASPPMQEIRVDTGVFQRVTLAGGHQVELLGPAYLRYAEDRNPVEVVRLEGQGVFDVSHSATGLRVETESGSIVVGGTSFGVSAQPMATAVYVLEGFVHITPARLPGVAVRVDAGYQSQMRPDEHPAAPVRLDEQALVWMDRLRFDSVPLPEVVRTIASYFDTPVEVDAALREESISGVFNGRDGVEGVLNLIAESTGAQVSRLSGGGFLLRRQP